MIELILRLIETDQSIKPEHVAKSLGKRKNTSSEFVPFIKSEDIEDKVQRVLHQIGYQFGPVSLSKTSDLVSDKLDYEINCDTKLCADTLGMISFDSLRIDIDESQAETKQRARFTLAHEFGHLFLAHSRYLSAEFCRLSNIDLDNPQQIEIEDIRRMEWQANFFASCLLLPKHQFVESFLTEIKKLNLHNRGFGSLYLDDQACNIESYIRVTSLLKRQYEVSRSVVRYRLINLKLLNDARKKPEKSLPHSLQKYL